MSDKLPLGTTVYITYNSAHLVDAIFANTRPSDVLIYDNASKDGTAEYIRKRYPNAKLITSDVNKGYGRAANAAFEQVSTPYALLLNPDVNFTANRLTELLKVSATLDSNWLYIAPNTGHIVTEIDQPAPIALKEISHATGCALLVNIENFKKLGGFDANIFLYYEEMDLSVRALNAGYKMYYAEDIHIPHNSKQSSVPSEELDNLRNWHFQWSSLYYKRKHKLHGSYWSSIFKNLISSHIKQLFCSAKKQRAIRQKRAATIAFLKKKKAFLIDGQPYSP